MQAENAKPNGIESAIRMPPFFMDKTPMRAGGRVEQSRLQVYNVTGVPLTDGKRQGFGLNIYYVNSGNIPVRTMWNRAIIVSSPKALTEDEELKNQIFADSVPPPKTIGVSEIQPGIAKVPPEHFFSAPGADDEIASMWGAYQLVLAGKQRMYVFVTLKYTDKELPSNKVRVTEFCGWFVRTFDVWHNCGSGRIYVANR